MALRPRHCRGHVRTLEPDELRRTLDPGELQFSSTADVVPFDRMLSQPRAREALGAVNEKIEGFFALCRAQGLTGDQGVVIPTANVRHLMLDPEVVDAVREGVFHVWAIDSVDEGIELLTGTVAGTPDEDGVYPEDSFHGRAQARIAALSELARESRRPATAAESP